MTFKSILAVLEADALGQYYIPGLRVHWSVGPIRGSAFTGQSMELNVDTVGGDPLARQVRLLSRLAVALAKARAVPLAA